MLNDQLVIEVTNEARLWSLASNYDHLQSLWENRIKKETHQLTDKQAKAVAIAQAAAFALAMQLITVNMMREMSLMLKIYSDVKGCKQR